MIFTCYYCNKDLPSSQMKRCARCLLVTYCSKECQTLSWKSSHKMNCKINPSATTVSEPPAKFSHEWIEAQVDRELTRWLQLWRSCFLTWAPIALDLANHPADRIMTHCMQVTIQPRNFEDSPARQYQVVDASIVSTSDVQAALPELEVVVDPTDFTRLRLVVILQNYKGELRRARLIQWNDLNVDTWRKMSKEDSAALAGPDSAWAQTLMDTVNTMSPKQVENMLGRKRSPKSLDSKEVEELLSKRRS